MQTEGAAGGGAVDGSNFAPIHSDVGVDKVNCRKLQRVYSTTAARPLRPDCAVGDDHLEAVVPRCCAVDALDEQRWVCAAGAEEG